MEAFISRKEDEAPLTDGRGGKLVLLLARLPVKGGKDRENLSRRATHLMGAFQ